MLCRSSSSSGVIVFLLFKVCFVINKGKDNLAGLENGKEDEIWENELCDNLLLSIAFPHSAIELSHISSHTLEIVLQLRLCYNLIVGQLNCVTIELCYNLSSHLSIVLQFIFPFQLCYNSF